MKRLLALVLCGCSGAPYAQQEKAPKDASPVQAGNSADAGVLTVFIPPWVGLPSSLGTARTDARAPAQATPDAGGFEHLAADAGAPETSDPPEFRPSDSGPPLPQSRLPAELVNYVQYLDDSDVAPCPALETAVRQCCEASNAFSCDNAWECSCDAEPVGHLSSLCHLAPGTPLHWECGQ